MIFPFWKGSTIAMTVLHLLTFAPLVTMSLTPPSSTLHSLLQHSPSTLNTSRFTIHHHSTTPISSSSQTRMPPPTTSSSNKQQPSLLVVRSVQTSKEIFCPNIHPTRPHQQSNPKEVLITLLSPISPPSHKSPSLPTTSGRTLQAFHTNQHHQNPA